MFSVFIDALTFQSVVLYVKEYLDHYNLPEWEYQTKTNQGTNFTSELLKELYRMLGIKVITTSPYHPQTDGLVERLNQTLKLMLKKTSRSNRRQWDKILPMVLFAYREITQETTGFSSFDILYSKDVKGPMDILKDQWIATQPEENDITSYVLSLHQHMEEAHEIAQ